MIRDEKIECAFDVSKESRQNARNVPRLFTVIRVINRQPIWQCNNGACDNR